jgi:O-antigen/teichoic acid export membrane protein
MLYGIFYILAPFIAGFYVQPVLCNIVRVYTISLIFNSLTIVQTAKLTIEFKFKEQSIISIATVMLSGTVGVWMAYHGFGVWALVFQGLLASFLRLILIWIFTRWVPSFVFSIDSFKQLFSFGSKLLGAGLIDTIYNNIYEIVIGKLFNAADVGYYNRGKQFAYLPSDTASVVVKKVNYPVLVELQDDNEKLVNAYAKLLRMPLYLLFPVLFGMAILARPLIRLILGEKWLPSAFVLQIMCMAACFDPLTSINLNLLYVKGRSDLVLKLDIIKKPIAFVILFVSIPFGLMWMCIGQVLYSIVAFAMNCHYTKKLLNYGFSKQFKEVFPYLIYSAIMAGCVWIGTAFLKSDVMKLSIGIIIGVSSYLLLSILFKDNSLKEILRIIKRR